MQTKVKKFSKKLMVLLLAVLMVVSCFSGVLTTFAASSDVKYSDEYVEYNDLAWAVLSDEQAATALLDYLDALLAENGPSIETALGNAVNGAGISVIKWNAAARQIKLSAVVINASVDINLRSVNEVLHTIESVAKLISDFGGVLGDAGNIQLSSTAGMTRENTSSCDIIRGILGILQKNAADYNGKDVIGEFLRGGFDLGTIGNLANLDIYKLLGGLFNAPDGYQSNFVYNIVQSLLFNNTNWFTAEEITGYQNDPKSFVFDTVLVEKLNTKLLQQINVNVTYPYGTASSKDRYKEIIEAGGNKGVNGYDANLCYTEDGNVYIFQYEGMEPLQFSRNDSLFAFGYRALKIAWNTVLKDTLGTLHVNNDVNRGHGANFDNQYYYWARDNGVDWVKDISDSAFANNYSEANLNAWATAVYEAYGATSPAEFLGWVKDTFTYDRTAQGEGKWDDINSNTLFGKLRYSPLADFGFNMTTGPINLYFLQTGFKHLDEFFSKSYDSYSSMVAGLNDALVAAVKDLFVDSAVRTNVYNSGNTTYPKLDTTGNLATIDDTAIKTIAATLVGNALDVIQYTADSADSTILKAFYDAKGAKATLEVNNIEEAMIPLLIACLGNINLNGHPLSKGIHAEDWDKCKDAEGVAFVALREYLSYILPNKDYNSLVSEQDGSYVATLEGTLLPMARDAIVYVMQGYVPVSDKDGNRWDVTKTAVDDPTTIFDLLNSVAAYYGGEYTFKNSKVTKDTGAMAVGALLGICDPETGKSLVNNNKGTTLWNTIDLVANKLLPTLGSLQYGDTSKKGAFNSEDLFYNDIIKGVLEISDTKIHSSGLDGVSNFIYRLLTIVSAEEIQSKEVIYTVYDVVAELLNGLFGARYNGQGWTEVIPVRTDAMVNPFDNLLQKETLAGTDGKSVGAIQKAICNFVEFTGYGTSGVKTYPDSILRAVAFALQAVNSFIPSAIAPIAEYDLELPTVSFTHPAAMGVSAGGTYSDSVTIKYNALGVNSAYIKDGQVTQMQRYDVKVKDVSVTGDFNATANSPSDTQRLLHPGDTLTLGTTTTGGSVGNPAKYKCTVTYDLYLGSELVFENLTTVGYQLVSSEQNWKDVVYPADRNGMLASTLENDSANKTMTSGGYTAYTTTNPGGIFIGYPQYIVLDNGDAGAIENYQFRIRATSKKSVDGWYCYDNKTVIDYGLDGKGTTQVEVNNSNAIPVFDKETGDILNKEKIDILVYKETKDDNGNVTATTYYDVNGSKISATTEDDAWQRNTDHGSYANDGFAQGYDSTVYNNLNPEGTAEADKFIVRTRDHVAFTLAEAYGYNIVAASHKNALGIYEYIYMKSGGTRNGAAYNYDATLGFYSARGPVDGIYLAEKKITVERNKSAYTTDLFKYDGETKIPIGEYPVKLRAYRGDLVTTDASGKECTLVVGNRDNAESVTQKVNQIQNVMSKFRPSDFRAIDETIGGTKYTQTLALAEAAVYSALESVASPMTPVTALQLSDNEYLAPNTTTVATEYGDRAYVPFTESNIKSTTNPDGIDFPVDVIAAAYVGDGKTGVDGVYYFDKACTMPIYSNVELKTSDVTGDKDPAGIAVIEGTGNDTGKWYLKNSPSYEREWDTSSYAVPWYRIKTDSTGAKVQATDSMGRLLYEQITYVYRNKDSEKVNSDFEWYAKFPATSYRMIENDGVTDNRGLFSKSNDYLTYVLQIIAESIDLSVSYQAFEDISLVRNGLNNNNFEVVTYNKMVDHAKIVERGYTLDITYYDKLKEETVTDRGVPFSKFNGYINNPDIEVQGVQRDEYGNVIGCTGVNVNANLSSVQIEAYTRQFNTYLNSVQERGYLGTQLEKEIVCAAGNPYTAMSVVNATEDADATVAYNSAATVPFGSLDSNNKLVNNGPVIYAPALWSNYVNSLAAAVAIATEGNTTYAHKDSAAYVPAEKATYTCQVTDCYTADTNLQVAEIALEAATAINVANAEGGYLTIDGVKVEPGQSFAVEEGTTVTITGTANEGFTFAGFEGENAPVLNEDGTYSLYVGKDAVTVTPVFDSAAPAGHSVSASLVVATNNKGATNNVGVSGDYTITLKDADDAVVASTVFSSTLDNHTFTIPNVPDGTYTATITSAYSLERSDITVVVNGADVTGPAIPIIACDFDNSAAISAMDAVNIYKAKSLTADNAYLDLDGSGAISAMDAVIVYGCGAGAVTMNPITIK